MRIDKPIDEIKICIRGITFRDGVKELYHSRNLALARLLREKGLKVYVSDELFSREEIEKLGLDQIEPGDADVVFDPFRLEVTIK